MANKADIRWWSKLDRDWKEELVRNLLDSPKYRNRNLVLTDIYELLDESAEIITEIVNIENLHLSWHKINDPAPLFHLKKIDDFLIQLPDWDDNKASFLDWYPEHLRSKVRRLDLDGLIFYNDLSPLIDFINLEILNCRDCQIESLEGIQNLTKLKIFKSDQGNSYSDLNPLRGLNLVSLNIQSTKVTDISPLIDLPSLEWIDLGFLSISDLSPLLKMPNLKSVVVPANVEIQKDKLEEYLINYQYIDDYSGQGQSIPGQFDYNKSWNLIPFYPFDEFTGALYEGRIIDNATDFNTSNGWHPISNIKIADSFNICSELTQPVIYPIKIDKGTRLTVDKPHRNFWYASKVKLLNPLSFWDLLPSDNTAFKGNINFCHQPFFPEGLVLPKIMKRNLRFWECTLPKTMNLPEIIEGSLEIIDCVIPHEWSNNYPFEVGNLRLVLTKLEKGTVLPKKVYGDIDFHRVTEFEGGVVMPDSYLSVTAELTDFPADFKLLNTKLKTLTFEECNLPKNFKVPEAFYSNLIFTEKTIPVGLKWPKKYIGNLSFVASGLPSGFKLPGEFDGILIFKDMPLPADLQLPISFNGILEFRNVQIPDGFKLPSKISGKLKISKSEIMGCLHLPSNDNYDFELNKGTDLSEFEIPEAVFPRLKLLPSWYFDE